MDETQLEWLFDFQRFAENEVLAELISKTQARYGTAEASLRELSDDEVDLWAAGDFDAMRGLLLGEDHDEH